MTKKIKKSKLEKVAIWVNLKTKNEYEYLGVALDATNGNENVQYAVYRPKGDGLLYVRKLKEFAKKFKPL